MKTICVTGCAGFIGYHVCERLLAQGDTVIGIDSLNDYYDPALKCHRILRLNDNPKFSFTHADLSESDVNGLSNVMADADIIIHLAAQPGVARSKTHSEEYFNNNVIAFWKVLETCATRHKQRPTKLFYASSSSVYGDIDQNAYREFMTTSKPLSFYAATKKSNEIMAHSYSHVYGFPSIGMRFFTVYGPWGRPDMAYWKFADAITKGEPVYLHDGGSVTRDFTYIDDIVDGIMLLMYSFAPDHTSTVYNIGSQNPYSVSTLLSLIEKELCKRATTISVPLPAGMAKHTCADNWKLHTATDFIARTSLADGIKRFVNWYKKYHEKGK